jgi:transcriptional regulator with XRE-family HTH domain
MDIFPTRLKSARQAKRFTQRELADRVGMDQGHISRLENGGKGISMEHLHTLAKELGVSISHLLGEDIMEDTANYNAKGERAKILANYKAPNGLRDLASDTALAEALKITDEEWKMLSSISVPTTVRKDGYVQLLVTVRAIC